VRLLPGIALSRFFGHRKLLHKFPQWDYFMITSNYFAFSATVPTVFPQRPESEAHKASCRRILLTAYRTQPPWEFLLTASCNTLQSYELSRLSHAANLRKEIASLIDAWIEENSAAMLARWLIEQRQRTVAPTDDSTAAAPPASGGVPASVAAQVAACFQEPRLDFSPRFRRFSFSGQGFLL
jgi:hypothetical protein